MKRSSITVSLIAGVLLAAPLIAISALAWRWLGFPFLAFDAFDLLARFLPGPLITASIETMVRIIHALHLGATATVAKAAEQGIGLITFFVAFVIFAGLLLILTRRTNRPYFFGSLWGFILAALLAVPAARGQTARVPAVVSVLWTFLLLQLWGFTLGWLARRLNRPSVTEVQNARLDAIDRRQLLIQLGEASAVITVIGAVVGALSSRRPEGKAIQNANAERWSATHQLPNADAIVKPAPGTRPEYTPLESHYRIDINTEPPVVREENWKLHFTGFVERPSSFALEELHRFDPVHQFVTLACISNLVAGDLIGTTRWTGVSLQRILQEVRPLPKATHLKITAVDGFYETVALETIRQDARVMLAYAWDGVPLLAEHGFPLRIYIPDRYGMKQPKWIQSIELTNHTEDGYWVKRSWDAEARMRATSVIDTISSNMMIAEGAGHSVIPLGGIAHAGARGISKVQVQVDQEPWRDAQLRTPLSQTTWVIWRYDWPFTPGRHTFTVRYFERDGTPQIVEERPPYPSGATGLHSIKIML